MDNFTFTFVSAAAALGGAIGTAVGYKKLASEREHDKVMMAEKINEAEEKAPMHVHFNPRTDRNMNAAMLYATDFTRTVGYLGYHSLYGMIVYPWMPFYSLGGMLRKDAEIKKQN